MRRFLLCYLLLAGVLFCLSHVYSQNGKELEDLKKDAPRVFMDCRRCDRDYIRTEITFVNFVRDRQESDIHLLVTDQSTGSGGQEYTMAFLGRNQFAGMDQTVTYVSNQTDTRDEIRKGMVEAMKRGLFPFLLKTPLCEYISVNFRQRFEPTAVQDKWNFWVFSISLDGRISGESTRSSKSIDVNFSANRVTPEWKIRLGLSGDYDERKYEYEEETIISISKEKDFSGLVAKSLNDHWSLGGWVETSSSTYRNIGSLYTIAPALEYNFFPYSESTRRQLRCMYKIGVNRAHYLENTIYNKMSETLYNQSLTLSLEVREPWGNATVSMEGSHYFHDAQKNRLTLWGYLSFRIFRGLSMNVRANYERIHDQLSLPVGEASLDEVLLRRRELATDYEYSLSLGVSYTFGSVFSNVVNPRFGSTRRWGRGRF